MLEPQYSGYRSEAFWELVNVIDDLSGCRVPDDKSLYSMGCDLQNLEGEVLQQINIRLGKIKHRLAPQRQKSRKRKHKE